MKKFLLKHFAILLPVLFLLMLGAGVYVGIAHGLEAAVNFAQWMNLVFWIATVVWIIALVRLISMAGNGRVK